MATEPTKSPSSRWPTPRLLRAHSFAIVALAALLLFAGEGTLANARRTLRTIGKDAAPSIVAAQEIQLHLADLDASAATMLLEDAKHAEIGAQLFELRRASLTRRLVDASQNITYGDAEKLPIIAIGDGLQRYLEGLSQARAQLAAGDRARAIDAYVLASDLLHAELLPAARALDAANKKEMDDVYASSGRATSGAEGIAATIGAALVVALILTQLFTLRRFRRLTSPPLLAATVLAVGFTAYLVQRFGEARADLKIAKEDAFESIHLLTRTRAIAYDARGDERRWLLDPARAARFERSFRDSMATISSAPALPPEIESTMRAEGATPPFTGLFADELANVTFRGEREAALDMARAFADFDRGDAHVRATMAAPAAGIDDATRLARARDVALGEANDAFETFDASAQRVQLVNEDAFEKVLEEADRGLERAEIADPALALAIAALAWIGVRPRLREYD